MFSKFNTHMFVLSNCQEHGEDIWRGAQKNNSLVKRGEIALDYVRTKMLTCLPDYDNDSNTNYTYYDFNICLKMMGDESKDFKCEDNENLRFNILVESCNMIRNIRATLKYFLEPPRDDSNFSQVRRNIRFPFNINYNMFQHYTKKNEEHVMLHFLFNNTFIVCDSVYAASISLKNFLYSLFRSAYLHDIEIDEVLDIFESLCDKTIPITIFNETNYQQKYKASICTARLNFKDFACGDIFLFEEKRIELQEYLLFTFDSDMIQCEIPKQKISDDNITFSCFSHECHQRINSIINKRQDKAEDVVIMDDYRPSKIMRTIHSDNFKQAPIDIIVLD